MSRADLVVDVVLPARNEAAALPGVLAALPAGCRAIVVDNGSTDGTGELARRLGATVITEPRPGFGSACYAGLLAAEADLVAFLDADGSFDPADLVPLATLVAEGRAQLALGARQARRGAWPWHARIANRVLVQLIRQRSGLRLHDLGPMRVARRADLVDLHLQDRRSGWPLEMVLRAHAAGWRIVERPVDYRPRIGRSKVTGTVRGTLTAITDMSRILR